MAADDIFKPTEMASLLSAAILQKMGDDDRDALFASAMEYLLTPRRDSSGIRSGMKTPVQEAFEQAAATVIQKVAREVLEETPEFQAKLRELIKGAIESALDGDPTFKNAIEQGVAHAMAGKDRW